MSGRRRDELEVNVTRIRFATLDNWDEAKDSAVNHLEDVQAYLQKLQNIAGE